MQFARYSDGKPFTVDAVFDDRSGLKMVDPIRGVVSLPSSRREIVLWARDEQEAIKTMDYHFGHSALWWRFLP